MPTARAVACDCSVRLSLVVNKVVSADSLCWKAFGVYLVSVLLTEAVQMLLYLSITNLSAFTTRLTDSLVIALPPW